MGIPVFVRIQTARVPSPPLHSSRLRGVRGVEGADGEYGYRCSDGTILREYKLNFALSESVPDASGRPQERHVKFLAGIYASQFDDFWKDVPEADQAKARRRGVDDRIAYVYFWDSVMLRLDDLGERITPQERAAFEAEIAEVVPRLSAQEAARLIGARNAVMQALSPKLKGRFRRPV